MRPSRFDTAMPWLIVAASAVHTAVACAASPGWRTIRERGVWASVSRDDYPAMTNLWFTAAGVGLFGWGLLTRRVVLTTGSLPAETGPLLLAMGVPVSVMMPVSGGWVLSGLGIATVARRRQQRRAGRAA